MHAGKAKTADLKGSPLTPCQNLTCRRGQPLYLHSFIVFLGDVQSGETYSL